MRDRAAGELEGRIGGVVGIRGVGLAGLVDARGNVGGAEARHRLDRAEQVVEHVAPVRQHIEDDAAAFLLAVVPARALRRLPPVALEHPVAELAAHRQDAAEEAGVLQHFDLAQAGQVELVLHHAALDAFVARCLRDRERFRERLRHRLFAIDVLAGRDRLAQERDAHLGRAGVEEHRVVRAGEGGVEIGRRSFDTVLGRDGLDLLGVAADQHRVGHHAVAVREQDAALIADRADRTDQVLIIPHAAGDAVHDDAEALRGHVGLSS